MANQMEKKMDNEMETGIYIGDYRECSVLFGDTMVPIIE